jgi:hypothetical protein
MEPVNSNGADRNNPALASAGMHLLLPPSGATTKK